MSVLNKFTRSLSRFAPQSLFTHTIRPIATTRLIKPSFPCRSYTHTQHVQTPLEGQTHDDLSTDKEWQYGYSSEDLLFEKSRTDPSNAADPTGRSFAYLTTMGAAVCWAGFGRAAVNKFIATLSASADVMAIASIEVDISAIEEGRATTVKWRGKPVFIRHRTKQEIEAARRDDTVHLRDQQTDAERVQNEKWVILVGVCTHLGCVPINGAGDFGGWFCPCHGSHYDTSGRIRKGPAPLNLEVPQYKFLTDTSVLLG